MGALGNLLGMLSISIPSPFIRIELHLSQLPPLLIGVTLGPSWGAIAGALSLIMATLHIGNPLIPLGNAILAGIAGLAARRFRPLVACLIGELAETPFIWFSILAWAGIICGVPLRALIPIIGIVNLKAFLEVLISASIIEMLLRHPAVPNFICSLKGGPSPGE